jgi:hypothetical protein
LEDKADLHLLDAKGKSPLTLARESGLLSLIDYLDMVDTDPRIGARVCESGVIY